MLVQVAIPVNRLSPCKLHTSYKEIFYQRMSWHKIPGERTLNFVLILLRTEKKPRTHITRGAINKLAIPTFPLAVVPLAQSAQHPCNGIFQHLGMLAPPCRWAGGRRQTSVRRKVLLSSTSASGQNNLTLRQQRSAGIGAFGFRCNC